MAYQNVGTPRFYVDTLTWLKSSGLLDSSEPYQSEAFDFNPSNQLVQPAQDHYINFPLFPTNFYNLNFIAILGHNFGGKHDIYVSLRYTDNSAFEIFDGNTTNISGVNYVKDGTIPGYNGFSITTFDPVSTDGSINRVSFNNQRDTEIMTVGACLLGTYYDMPHSPDLSLTMTREYGGIKTIETKGGASLSNAFYTKPPMWGDHLAAWELHGTDSTPPNQKLSRSGRRVWDLSFSYLDSGDVFGSNQLISRFRTYGTIGTDGVDDADTGAITDNFEYNILSDTNFYSQVIHKTNGGQLPFIFQPDKNDSNPGSGFAICKLDMKEFKFEQVANGVYNMKLKIREVW